MNEVKATAMPLRAQVLASSAGTGKVNADQGSALPTQSTKPAEVVEPKQDLVVDSASKVKEAIAHINDYVQSVQRDLQFSVDEELGSTVVKVVDRQSGDLIRQIPNDVVLELAKSLKQNGDINLLQARG